MNTKLKPPFSHKGLSLLALIVIGLLAPAVARAQFLLATNNGSISITGYTGPGGNVVIPSTTNGFPVTSIGDNAFAFNLLTIELNRITGTPIITNVTIPGSVTNIGASAFSDSIGLAGVTLMSGVATIGDFAFWECTNLTSLAMSNGIMSIGGDAFAGCTRLPRVTIPGSVTSIGFGAFANCTRLDSVIIPSSVTNIGSTPVLRPPAPPIRVPGPMPIRRSDSIVGGTAPVGSALFDGCRSLTNIAVDALNPVFASAAGVLYNKTKTALIEYPGGKVGSYAIPSSVTTIGDQAFEDCVKLTGVTIPANVTYIGSQAFDGCSNLSAVTIPSHVIGLGYEAFSQCTKLTTITFPNNIPGIWYSECYGCANLTNVIIGAGVATVAMNAFGGCPKLLTFSVSAGNTNYTSLDGVLFNKSKTVLELFPSGKAGVYTISTTVTALADEAFENCSKLSGIQIPNNVKTIGIDAFFGCNSLTGLAIPNGVTSLGPAAISACSNLTTVTIGSGVTNIGLVQTYGYGFFGGQFDQCPRLASITVDARNPNYSSTNGVLFDKAKTTLLQYPQAKNGTYTLPNCVVNIADNAFEGCTGLKSVTIPNSVTNLGNGTFADCTGLTNVNFGTGITSLQYDFSGCTNLARVFFPGNAPTSFYYLPFGDAHPTLYYLPGTSGWGSISPYVGVPTIMLNAPNPAGALSVTIMPWEVATAGAQWQVDGGLLQPAGANVGGLTVGQHTVNFLPVSGWLTPSNQIVVVNSNSTAYATGYYSATGDAAFICETNADNTLTIIEYAGQGGEVIIPAAINGMAVTSIGEGTFNENMALTSITIPGSVVSIGAWTFSGCTNLAGVTMVNGLEDIGPQAFDGCYGLTNVTIPATVTNIGDHAFGGCYKLRNVIIIDGVTSIGYDAFGSCASLTSVTIPGSIVSVGDFAFNSSGLTNVTLLNGVANIGHGAFEYNPLTSVTVPGSVTNLGDYAFYACSSLTNVVISNGVPNIGNGSFKATALTDITIPGSVISIGDSAFDSCRDLASVTIPNGVTRIGNSAFAYCYGLTSVAIPASVTNIGPLDFSACYSLTNIAVDPFNTCYASAAGVLFNKTLTRLIEYPPGMHPYGSYAIPATVTNIGDDAFEGCFSLYEVTIPTSVVIIGNHAFANCGEFAVVMIPSGVTSIGDGAFWQCWSLTNFTVDVSNPSYASVAGLLFDKSLTTLIQCPAGKSGSYAVPGSVITIANNAFEDCSGLTGVTIPYGVASIGESAFQYCSRLAEVAIPGSVITIGNDGFFACSSLTNVTLGPGVFSIGDSAFCYCPLTTVSIPDSVFSIGQSAFEGCERLTSLTIPEGVASIGDYAFSGCGGLTNLIIPDSITSIGNGVFEGCYSLGKVVIPASVTNLGYYAFSDCTNLMNIYCAGNAPALDNGWRFPRTPFYDVPGTVYHLPGTTGWTNTFGGLPTALWYQPNPVILENGSGLDVQNKRFGFTIAWATNVSVVVEACTNLSNPVWRPVQTNALANGTNYFSDAKWTNYPGRFYRVRSP